MARHHDAGPGAPGDLADLDLAARVAVDVQACPLVVGLHGGDRDAIATRTPGGRLVGVRVDGDAIMVGVVCRPSATTDAVVEQVRSAALAQAPDALITVSVTAHHDPATDVVTTTEPRP